MKNNSDQEAINHLRGSAAVAPLIEEGVVIEETVDLFGNRGQWPQFMLRLPGIPGLAVSAALAGNPVQLMVKGHEEWEALHAQFVEDLAAIAAGKPSRELRKRVCADADRVGIQLIAPPEGSRSRKRSKYLVPPDLKAALAYVLNAIILGEYGKRLARCGLQRCSRFFFRDGKRRYHNDACSAEANEIDAPNRARDARARKRAIELLIDRGYKRALAPQLIREVKDRGLTAAELLKRAEAKIAAKPEATASKAHPKTTNRSI